MSPPGQSGPPVPDNRFHELESLAVTQTTIGIIINGATSRIATTQHLESALVPIRKEGGIEIGGKQVMPELILTGRDAGRLDKLASALGIERWTTDLDSALGDRDYEIFFDASVTHLRAATLMRAIEAGKHIYSEKPVAASVAEGLKLLEAAEARGLKHGAVEDKVYLPGLRKLGALMNEGFLGTIRHFRLDFGWWVFDGTDRPCQRPSWNYRHAQGGGLISDMHPHWRYVIERTLGPIRRVAAAAWTATPRRIDEEGKPYDVDVEDSTAALIELENGAIGMLTASWATRVWDDEPLTLHVDGSDGSAVAGLHHCHAQSLAQTPQVEWSPNADVGDKNRSSWVEARDPGTDKNSYRVGWEGFLAHVVAGEPFWAPLSAGIRDVQLAEACLRSDRERRWVDMQELDKG